SCVGRILRMRTIANGRSLAASGWYPCPPPSILAEASDARVRVRPLAVREASRPPEGVGRAAVAPAPPPFQARGGRAHLRGAPGSVGGAGSPRLRRRRLQRASHVALRPHELAEPPRGVCRAAHPADQ